MVGWVVKVVGRPGLGTVVVERACDVDGVEDGRGKTAPEIDRSRASSRSPRVSRVRSPSVSVWLPSPEAICIDKMRENLRKTKRLVI